jgi:hypothetical protein
MFLGIANILPVVFGPKDVMYNPNALSHSDWKALKEEEDITGTRNRGYGYADMPIRPLQDFVEDDEKKAKRKRNKGVAASNDNDESSLICKQTVMEEALRRDTVVPGEERTLHPRQSALPPLAPW